MKKMIVLDVDGVLADFEGRLVETLEKEFGEIARSNRQFFRLEDRWKDRPEIVARAKEYVENPNFYYCLEEYPEVTSFAQDLNDFGYPLMFVSSRPLSAETFTRRWINKKLDLPEYVRVFCGVRDKADFLKEIADGVDFVIDDNPEEVKRLQKAGFSTLCWEQEWNRGVFPRLYVRSDGDVMLWMEEDKESFPFFEAEQV